MQKISYIYKGETYDTAWDVRRAISKKENKGFGPVPDENKEAFWANLGVTYQVEEVPDPEPYQPTEEELAQQAIEEAKRERADAVEKITVVVDGMEFDGDETSQNRMARTVAGAVAQGYDLDTTMRTWVLADNTVAQVSVRQLAKALEAAGNKQTELWTVPYETDNAESQAKLAKVGV